MSTLVYHAGALGDFLTILPTVRLWQHHHPDDRITLLGRAPHASLVRGDGYFHETWDISRACFSGFFRTDCPEELLGKLSGFSTAIVFASCDSPLLHSIRRAGVANVLHQAPFPERSVHVVTYHLGLLARYFPCPEEIAWYMPLLTSGAPTGHRRGTQQTNVAAIHPGSGSRIKNWPLDRFVALADRLRRRGLRPVWVLGPAEESLCPPSKDQQLRTDDLSEVADLLRRCVLFVGNDSGITHLSAAIGVPTVAIFGPSDPVLWRPVGTNSKVIRTDTDCAPCHATVGKAGIACNRRCLQGIPVDEVLTACLSLTE